MTQKGFAIIPFLVIIALLSAGIIGGSLYIKSAHPELIQKQKTLQSTTQTISQQLAPVTQVTTSTMDKHYVNKKYNYNIVLPIDWIFDQNDYIDTEIISLPKSTGYNSENYGTNLFIRVFTDDASIHPIKGHAQFDEWFKKEKSTEESRVETKAGYAPTYLSKIGNTVIDNNPAQQFNMRVIRGDGTEPWYSIVTWVRKNNLNYYIEMGGKEVSVKNFTAQYSDIIATFKFTKN